MSIVQRSVIVAPCYAIEDLPTDAGHALSADFLAAWTVGWDPRLLAGLNVLPEWKRNDTGSLDLEDALVVIPEMSRSKVDIPQRERLNLGRCVTIDSEQRKRGDLWNHIREAIEKNGDTVSSIEPLMLGDFYALGYLVLQIQIMARKLRYSWNLDWLAFSEQVLAAANASVQGDVAETDRWLQASFDSLSQERDRYCSQQIHLLDIAILAKTTLGESLSRQLETERPFNVLANASLLHTLQKANPQVWHCLSAKIKAEEVGLIGGLEDGVQSNYSSYIGMDHAFSVGKRSYESLGIESPKIFSQFEPGMGSLLPDLLVSHGFKGVLLNAWSGGRLPTKETAKIRWQSHSEGEAIDCIVGHVADAANAETFLQFTSLLSKQLDYHHVPTLLLAHWPDSVAEGMSDLIAVVKRSPALGTFETANKYFKTTNQPYGSDTYVFKQFQLPLPEDAGHRLKLQFQTRGLLNAQTNAERLRSTATLWSNVFPNAISHEEVGSYQALEAEYQKPVELPEDNDDRLQELTKTLPRHQGELVQSIAQANGISCKNADEANGFLIVNTASHPRRAFLSDLPGIVDESSSSRIFASNHSGDRSSLVVDLPPYGFVKVRASHIHDGPCKSKVRVERTGLLGKLTGKKRLIADADWSLANEHMEIQIDPKKGHLRSVYVPSKRGSRISGMASIVRGYPDVQRKWKESDFLEPKSVSLKVIENSRIRGVIEAHCLYAQTADMPAVELVTRYTLWKGARWVEVEVDCPTPHRNQFHCVWRTAWANESAILYSWQQGTKGKLPLPLQGVVELVEIDDVENKTYFASGGLSIHQRFEQRYLVTVLPYTGENGASEKFALGMDWPRPLETALDFLSPPLWCKVQIPTSQIDEGAWLAQSNVQNVNIQFERNGELSMLGDEGEPPISVDSVLWVQETRGKRAVSKLSFLKEVDEAWRIDADSRQCTKLDVEDGKILVNLRPSERSRIAVRWSNAT